MKHNVTHITEVERQLIILCYTYLITYTQIYNITESKKTMKQTKRAILEVSGAPQDPLLICSKMLHSYNLFEIKIGFLILSKILQMNRSSESKQEPPIIYKIPTTPP